jgi:hypothetical protein
MLSVSFRLAMILPLLALAACGSKTETQRDQAADEPTASSSEWVEPNPTEPAVPVTVPTTPMTNVPTPMATPTAK